MQVTNLLTMAASVMCSNGNNISLFDSNNLSGAHAGIFNMFFLGASAIKFSNHDSALHSMRLAISIVV